MHTTSGSRFAALAVLGLALGCGGSGGFQQSAAREQLTLAPPQVNDSQVREALALKPQLPKPYRLAVYFRELHAESEASTWRWDVARRQTILDLERTLRATGEVAELFPLAAATVTRDDLPAIRLAAARHGADAVLVVSGTDEVKDSANGWALAYLAILPMAFAPGNDLQALFLAHAEMWDVRNEYLYLAAEAESEASQQRPLFWLDSEAAVKAAQLEATQLLATELRERFRQLHAGSVN
jgi:hypothetical protein